MGITCSPFGTVEEKDADRLAGQILVIAGEQNVTTIVVGLPRPLKGGTNAQSEATVAFKQLLERKTMIPVKMWDERFTSRLADRGRPGNREQDAIAACYMLQNYLDSRAPSTEDS